MWKEPSQKFELVLLFIATFVTIISGQFWKFFFIFPLTIFFVWIVDVLFFTKDMFIYEPNFDYWKEATEEEY